MAEQKVLYMNAADLKNLDRSKIKSMTMTSGAIFLIQENNAQVEQNIQNEETSEIKFRARNEVKNEEEKEEEKLEEKPEENQEEKQEEKPEEKQEVAKEEKTEENKEEINEEEKVEINVEGEQKEEKEILRGPDGKPLLNDMLIYGYGQDQGADSNINLNPVPQNYEPIVPPNMPGIQNNEYQT